MLLTILLALLALSFLGALAGLVVSLIRGHGRLFWVITALVLLIVLIALLVWPGWARSAIWPTSHLTIKVGEKVVPADVLDPCRNGADPARQIEPLFENGAQVPSAYMGLDLNRAEVTSGLRYKVLVPAGAYMHLFVAINDADPTGHHLTYEVHGSGDGILTISTAWTIWCAAGNWDKALGGQARVMNAKQLPTPLKNIWMPIPASGVMPVPPADYDSGSGARIIEGTPAPVYNPPATGKATTGASCNPGAGWAKQADGSYHIGPLASDKAITFTVPTGGKMFYSFAGKGAETPATAGATVKLHEATLFCSN